MKKTVGTAAFILAAFAAFAARAESYPDRPITLIAPFAAGGASDALARAVADGLGKALGTSVIVENHAGAGGSIGVGLAAAAEPDGYTVVLGGNGSLVFAAGVYDLPYDVLEDMRPIGQVAEAQSAAVVRASLGVTDFAGLVARSREEPKLTYGSPGVGTALHLAGALFAKETGGTLVHVPYKGLAPALTDLQAGNIDVVFANVATLPPFLESGMITPLAIIDHRHSAQLPGVPTTAEAGYPGIDMITWYGLMTGAGVSDEKVAVLEGALAKVLKSPEFLGVIEAQGFLPAEDPSAASFRKVLDADFATWIPLIDGLGLSQ